MLQTTEIIDTDNLFRLITHSYCDYTYKKLAPKYYSFKKWLGPERCEGTSSVIESSCHPIHFICFCANRMR